MAEFEQMLTGGHPNSLGNTIEVVNIVLSDQNRFDELYQCYFSDDEVVRLRTSNAMKRVCKEHREWLIPYIDKLINVIAEIDQDSTRWTLAQLFRELHSSMSEKQYENAKSILCHNLVNYDDWIVLNQTMQTLSDWAKDDEALKLWLLPVLENLSLDTRGSVSKRSKKLIQVHSK